MKPNCIKVPKEICVETKVNPRKVSFPFFPSFFLKRGKCKPGEGETKHKADPNKRKIRMILAGEEASDPGMVLQAV